MRTRIFQSMCFLAVVTICLTACIFGVFFSEEQYNAVRAQLRSDAVYLEEAVTNHSEALTYLQRISVAGRTMRITLIDQDGTVLFDNGVAAHQNVMQLENHNERPEVQAARTQGYGEAIRDSATLGQRTFYYARLLEDGRVLRLSQTVAGVRNNLMDLMPYMVGLLLLTLLAALLIAQRQTARIIAPINRLDLEHPETNAVYDELAPLLSRLARQNTQIQNQLQELAAKQQEFTALTENMDEGLVIVNAEGYILSINKRALSIFGLREGDHRQKHILMVNHNLDLQQLMEKGLAGQDGELLLELDGRFYQIMANPIRLVDRVQGLVLLLLDVTEKRQQEQLRREFTANVSHELRTPLTAISGFAEIMAQGLVQPQDMQPFAEKIYREANRLIVLVNDIIQLSQLDEQQTSFAFEPVALHHLMEEVAQRLQPLALQTGVTLTCYTEPVTIQGARQVLQEIVYNLCENAIKYNKPQGNVKLLVVQVGPQAVIRVVDTGIGIAAEDRPRVFERFYRVDKSHSRLIGGTGLGLSIVKHGVQLHHGDISLESQLNHGTIVTVRLPVGTII